MKENLAYTELLSSDEAIQKLLQYEKRASSMTSREIALEFLPDVAPVERCLGSDLSRSILDGDFYQAKPVHNLEFTVYVALRALEYLNESPTRWSGWSGKPPNIEGTLEAAERNDRIWHLIWLRTAFRCILCMPFGYLISETALRGELQGAPSWSPAQQDMPDYIEQWGSPKATKTEFFIDPRETSLLTYVRLFGNRRSIIPMLAHAEADFFSDIPNKDNPIWKAYRRSISHVMAGRHYLALPFWWSFAINHEYIADPDYRPLSVDLRCRNGFTISSSDTTQAAATTETDGSEQPDASAETPQDAPTVGPDVSPMLVNAIEVARLAIDDKTFYANSGGCVFQGAAGRAFVVVPLFWSRLAQCIGNPSVTPELLRDSFVSAGYIECGGRNPQETQFAIRKRETRKRLGKCRTLCLSKSGERALFPGGRTFGDNEDLQRLDLDPEQSAA